MPVHQSRARLAACRVSLTAVAAASAMGFAAHHADCVKRGSDRLGGALRHEVGLAGDRSDVVREPAETGLDAGILTGGLPGCQGLVARRNGIDGAEGRRVGEVDLLHRIPCIGVAGGVVRGVGVEAELLGVDDLRQHGVDAYGGVNLYRQVDVRARINVAGHGVGAPQRNLPANGAYVAAPGAVDADGGALEGAAGDEAARDRRGAGLRIAPSRLQDLHVLAHFAQDRSSVQFIRLLLIKLPRGPDGTLVDGDVQGAIPEDADAPNQRD